jgi:hypothetical protein
MKFKFRVWDKLDKVYIYPDKGYQGHYILTLNGLFNNLQNGSGSEEYEVEQWTGLIDKMGRDIYLGDIVSFEYLEGEKWTDRRKDKGEVLFEDGMFCFKKGVWWATNDGNFVVDSLLVIGNINQTPELLRILDFIYPNES